MEKKMIYVAPTVKVTQVVLEQGIAVAISAMNSVQVYDWEDGALQAEDEGNIWLPV